MKCRTKTGEIRRSLLVILTLVTSTLVACSNQFAAVEEDREVASEFDTIFDQFDSEVQGAMAEHKVPGLALAIVNREGTLWSRSYGVDDLKTNNPVSADTVFSIQSISKLFTATAIMVAVQEGLINLDVPISVYLPDFSINSPFQQNPEDRITVRHLLSHRAGLTHEAPVGNNYNSYSPSFDAHVASISESWLRHPVGSQYSYSNLGIDLAAYIVQRVSGVPFEKYMDEKIFTPIGMPSSFVDTPTQNGDCEVCAVGHNSKFLDIPDYIPLTASGGVRTSLNDASRFVQFHLNRGRVAGTTLLDPKWLDEMYVPATLTPSPSSKILSGYGLGVAAAQYGNYYFMNHNGGGFGYSASMTWVPDFGIGVIVLTNSIDHPAINTKITERVLSKLILDGKIEKNPAFGSKVVEEYFATIANGQAPKTQQPVAQEVPPYQASWKRHLGEYRFIFGGGWEVNPSADLSRYTVKVFERDGYLYAGLLSTELRMIEHSPGLFFVEHFRAAIDFRGEKPTFDNIEVVKLH